jgi:hypothetical protein
MALKKFMRGWTMDQSWSDVDPGSSGWLDILGVVRKRVSLDQEVVAGVLDRMIFWESVTCATAVERFK